MKYIFRALFALLVSVSGIFCTYGQERVEIKINFNNLETNDLVLHFEDGKVREEVDFKKKDSFIIIDQPLYSVYSRIFVTY